MMMQLIRSWFIIFYLLSSTLICTAQQSIEFSSKLPIEQEFISNKQDEMNPYNRIWASYHIWGDVWQKLMQNVAENKIMIYGNNQKPLTIAELWDTAVYRDTVADVEGNLSVVVNSGSRDKLKDISDAFDALDLKEKWILNGDGKIEKKVIAFSPLGPYYRRFPASKPTENQRNDAPVFWLHPGRVGKDYQIVKIERRTDLVELHNSKDSLTLADFIMQGLRTGKLKAYDVEDKQKLLSTAEVDKRVNAGYDTLQVWNVEKQQYNTIFKKRSRSIDVIEFNEEWLIDSYGNIEIRIKEYKIIYKYIDDIGAFEGLLPLVWIKNPDGE